MLCRVFIFIIFSVATATAAIGNITNLCSTGCLNESDCIDKENICNDRSNENDHPVYDPIRPGHKRIHTRAVKPPCVLPPYPKHGLYEVLNLPQDEFKGPGQTLDSFVLRVSCEPGYGMMEKVPNSNGTLDVYCLNGVMQTMPECVRFCKLEPDPSVRYICPGNKLCPRYLAPDTRITPVCNSPVYSSSELLLNMQCIAGSWDYIARCKPDCGRITPEGDALLIDGTAAKRGELPWHVGIYRKITPYLQICGGSLVSNNVVISAAHCFWNDVSKQLPAANFAVASGKLYRTWDDNRDANVQRSDLLQIKIPELFQGIGANFQEDIAILTLSTPVIYKTYIRPVCLNFDHSFDNWHLQHNNLGKVAGWGLTGANGIASEYLNVAEMPFISPRICISTLPPAFRSLVTGDKFCAGYTNGTSLCKGDSGGGIFFPETEQGIDRYYLRGIVSTAPTTTNKLCNDRSYTTFTRITKHEDFIKNALAAAKAVKYESPFKGETCSTIEGGLGSCISVYECTQYLQILQESIPEATTILKQAHCGFIDNKPKVCCPRPGSSELPPDTTTPTITMTTTTTSTTLRTGLLPTPTPTRYSGGELFLESMPEPPECGVSSRQYSIQSGGNYVKPANFPWTTLLGYQSDRGSTRWLCGGSLISQRHVLTAAHCTHNHGNDLYIVRFGELDLAREDEATPVDVLIADVIEHEDYSSKPLANDIAILKLRDAVEYTYSIRPICLPKEKMLRERNFEDTYPIIAGWGHTEFGKPLSTSLQVQKMSVVNNSFCPTNKAHVIDERVLCASLNDPLSQTKNTCQGDSGGPLIQIIKKDNKEYFYQIGLVSYDKKCEETDSGSVYTRITYFIPWIEKQVVGDYERNRLVFH